MGLGKDLTGQNLRELLNEDEWEFCVRQFFIPFLEELKNGLYDLYLYPNSNEKRVFEVLARVHGLRAQVEVYGQVHELVHELHICMRTFELILFDFVELLRRLRRQESSECDAENLIRLCHERILKVKNSLFELPFLNFEKTLEHLSDLNQGVILDESGPSLLDDKGHQSQVQQGLKLLKVLEWSIQRGREIKPLKKRCDPFSGASLSRSSQEMDQKLKRIVSSWADQLGKKVDIQLKYVDSELKLEVLEQLMPILLQLIRNSIDHGIETPVERRILGKREEGWIQIQLIEHLGSVQEVIYSDDGRGIQLGQLLKQAESKGLCAEMKESPILSFENGQIGFFPGLSTKPLNSSFSGLGVGMVFVQSELRQMGFLLEVSSEVGRGVQLRMRPQNG